MAATQRDDIRIVMLMDRIQARLEHDPTFAALLEQELDILDQIVVSAAPTAGVVALLEQAHREATLHVRGPVTSCPMCASLHERARRRA